ncbi:MAG: diacylglycerol/lipid kinase family protein [bacterium]
MPPIGVIINPNASKNKGGTYHLALRSVLRDYGVVKETLSPEDISPVLDGMLREGIKILCIDGGDGTYQKVLTALIRLRRDDLPFILPLRRGTMNVLPNNVGVLWGAVRTCEMALGFLNSYSSGRDVEFVEVPLLEVRRRGWDAEYGHFFANGIFFRGMEAFYSGGRSSWGRALGTFLAHAVGGVLGWRRSRELFRMDWAHLEVDGVAAPWDRYLLILVSTLDRMIFGLRPFKGSPQREGKLGVFALSSGPVETVLNLPALGRGRGGGDVLKGKCLNAVASGVEIRTASGYTLNGELYTIDEPTTLEIALGPKLKFPKLQNPPP